MIPFGLLLLLIVLMLAALALERTTGYGVVYEFFATVSIYTYVAYPFAAIPCCVMGICNSVRAMRNGESRKYNALLLAAAVLSAVAIFLLSLRYSPLAASV